MESAIPPHLQVARTRHRRVPDDYQPPYPAFVARHQPAVEKVVMAYFGLQYRGEAPARAAALASLEAMFAAKNGPKHWDRAAYRDEAGYDNVVSVAYWDDQTMFEAWLPSARDSWTGDQQDHRGHGTFIELLSPSVSDYETLFSSLGRAEGVAALADSFSSDIMEHAYWGGMRDRIPQSQTSDMAPARYARSRSRRRASAREAAREHLSHPIGPGLEGHRRVRAQNVSRRCRADAARRLDFLRDEGLSVGCFANRYMTVLDGDGKPTEKSYGMSWWKSLAALERWSESHPTHVRIFGAAMKYLSSLGPAAKLRLYHEVTVARASDQFFEYLRCHERTGMLNAVLEHATAGA
jgi:aldoxime dehydratase